MRLLSTLCILILTGLLISSDSIAGWKTVKSKHFLLDIPSGMIETNDLNDEAISQYQYVEDIDGELRELYVIVLEETHKEIAGYNLDFEFTALSYSEAAAGALEGGLDYYEILTKTPRVKEVNGMECVKTEMMGHLGEVKVFYRLGVFKSERAFYQVLTWTLLEQRDNYAADMDRIISSFREK